MRGCRPPHPSARIAVRWTIPQRERMRRKTPRPGRGSRRFAPGLSSARSSSSCGRSARAGWGACGSRATVRSGATSHSSSCARRTRSPSNARGAASSARRASSPPPSIRRSCPSGAGAKTPPRGSRSTPRRRACSRARTCAGSAQ